MTLPSRLRPALAGLALALAAVFAPGIPAHAADQPSARPAPSAEHRIMVMLDLGPDHLRAGGDYGGGYSDALAEPARLRLARKIARDHRLTVLESWPMQLIGVDCVIMEVTDGRPIDAVVRELTGVKGVSWSQPLNQYTMQSRPPAAAAKPRRPGTSYNDRLYPAQPVSRAWKLASLHRMATGRGVTIAIVDSRIDTAHPDLAGRITAAPDFAEGARTQAERHGTGVAGIIAARPNNSVGIAGVAPGARILGLRACWERVSGGSTVCDSLSLAKALTYALENRADVINLSLTGPPDRLLQTLIGIALKRGITVVAAVDTARPAASFPAFVAGVVAVSDERLPSGTPPVYIAPGQDVPTTEPGGRWELVSGSSFAAAHVSGLTALVRELNSGARHEGGDALLGPRGTLDACAIVSRASHHSQMECDAR